MRLFSFGDANETVFEYPWDLKGLEALVAMPTALGAVVPLAATLRVRLGAIGVLARLKPCPSFPASGNGSQSGTPGA